MQTVREFFMSLILSYEFRKKTTLLRCTANQAGTGHKLHFQPKNPAWAKLAAINNKNGCGTAEVWCRQFGRVSYHWYYHIRPGKRGVIFSLSVWAHHSPHDLLLCSSVSFISSWRASSIAKSLTSGSDMPAYASIFVKVFSQIPAKVDSTPRRALLILSPHLQLFASQRPIES